MAVVDFLRVVRRPTRVTGSAWRRRGGGGGGGGGGGKGCSGRGGK